MREQPENPMLEPMVRKGAEWRFRCPNPRCLQYNEVFVVGGYVEPDTGAGVPDIDECPTCCEPLVGDEVKLPDSAELFTLLVDQVARLGEDQAVELVLGIAHTLSRGSTNDFVEELQTLVIDNAWRGVMGSTGLHETFIKGIWASNDIPCPLIKFLSMILLKTRSTTSAAKIYDAVTIFLCNRAASYLTPKGQSIAWLETHFPEEEEWRRFDHSLQTSGVGHISFPAAEFYKHPKVTSYIGMITINVSKTLVEVRFNENS